MIVPTINLNGTSKDELVELHTDAAQKIAEAIAAMKLAWPNGRDFQTAEPGLLVQAQDEASERLQLLFRARDEMNTIAVAISRQ